MGSQLQLCIPVGSHLIFKMHKVLVSTQQGQSMSPDLLRVLENVALMLSQDILVLGMAMVMDLEELALELVSTHLDQFMSPDPLRVLAREVLMLSQATIHRTTGHQLLLHMAPPPAMDVVASVVLSQDILDLAMVMDMV